MNESTVVLITLITFKLVLLGIGLWANQRSHSTTDFYLGGRQLGPWVAAISASASSSSAWTLLGVSGAAYLWGYSAIWLFPSVLAGFIFNWYWLAPRLRQLSIKENALTVTDLLVIDKHSPLANTIKRTSSLIIVFCFVFYIAAQFKGAGNSFVSAFDMDFRSAILIGAAVIMVYTLLGGFWAVSITDTLQGGLMALTAVVLPTAALIEVGGLTALTQQLSLMDNESFNSFTGPHYGMAAVGFIVGLLGISNGYPGQPHVVNRFMAIKNESSIRQGRIIAIIWALLVYSGMLLLGWSAKVLIPFSDNHESIFFEMTQLLFSPVISGIMIAAVLSAVMSTADSQILVASSSLSYDLPSRKRSDKAQLWISRMAVFGICLLAVLLAMLLDQTIFKRVLFAWQAIGSAFGPLLICRVLNRSLTNTVVLCSMISGFALTIIFNNQADLPGDVAERWIPFLIAFAIAWIGSKNSNKNKKASL